MRIKHQKSEGGETTLAVIEICDTMLLLYASVKSVLNPLLYCLMMLIPVIYRYGILNFTKRNLFFFNVFIIIVTCVVNFNFFLLYKERFNIDFKLTILSFISKLISCSLQK